MSNVFWNNTDSKYSMCIAVSGETAQAWLVLK